MAVNMLLNRRIYCIKTVKMCRNKIREGVGWSQVEARIAAVLHHQNDALTAFCWPFRNKL